MLRRVLVAGVAALAVAAPALAITGGSLDGAAHPAVGLVLADRGNGPEPDCTGSLVAPTVVVTAAHCVTGSDAWVSFDSRYVAGSSPLLHGTFQADTAEDLAVVVLDAPVDLTPIPIGSLVDSKDATFTNVGYGYYDRTFTFDGFRRQSQSTFTSATDTTLKLKENPGGVCFGDSGGPRLLDGAVVAVTGTGNKNCTGQSTSVRLDSATARTFLSRFLPVR